jgi:hypothetical protein
MDFTAPPLLSSDLRQAWNSFALNVSQNLIFYHVLFSAGFLGFRVLVQWHIITFKHSTLFDIAQLSNVADDI